MAVMEPREIDQQDLEGLPAQLRGAVLCPSDERYSTAREIHNAMFQKKPAVIARCQKTPFDPAHMRYTVPHPDLVPRHL